MQIGDVIVAAPLIQVEDVFGVGPTRADSSRSGGCDIFIGSATEVCRIPSGFCVVPDHGVRFPLSVRNTCGNGGA